jgi:hypothetical protein
MRPWRSACSLHAMHAMLHAMRCRIKADTAHKAAPRSAALCHAAPRRVTHCRAAQKRHVHAPMRRSCSAPTRVALSLRSHCHVTNVCRPCRSPHAELFAESHVIVTAVYRPRLALCHAHATPMRPHDMWPPGAAHHWPHACHLYAPKRLVTLH